MAVHKHLIEKLDSFHKGLVEQDEEYNVEKLAKVVGPAVKGARMLGLTPSGLATLGLATGASKVIGAGTDVIRPVRVAGNRRQTRGDATLI